MKVEIRRIRGGIVARRRKIARPRIGARLASAAIVLLAVIGLAEQITDENWRENVGNFIREIKRGKTGEAFEHSIEQCEELLRETAPLTVIKNELPNHLIMLD